MLREINDREQWGPLDGVLLYPTLFHRSVCMGARKNWGADWTEIIGFYSHKRGTYIWEKSDMVKGGYGVIRDRLMVPAKKQELWQAYENIQEEFKQVAQIITEALATRAEDQEAIRALALRWIDLMDRGWEIGTVPEIANFAAPEYLAQQLGAKVPALEMPQVLEVLLAPEKLSYHQQSDKELFELVIKYPSGIPERELQTYANNWFWLENSYLEIKRLTLADFQCKADDLLSTDCQRKLTEIDQYLERTKKRKQEVYLKYALGPEIQKLATELAFSIWWQDDRKGLMWRAYDLVPQLMHWAEKYLGVPFADQLMYTDEDWRALFKDLKRVPAPVLTERQELTVFSLTADGVTEIRGQEAKRLRAHFFPTVAESGEAITEFKGIVVSRGRVQGRVRILLSPRTVDEMQTGEILVTTMTSPDFVVAMRKAAAVVTDVGGLMSHAAIISRELNIPCIVGTKIATQVLKDGDLVEVNADKGIVLILDRE